MNKTVFILLILLASCTKKVEETWYAIQNNTDVDINCFFYAKPGGHNYEMRIPHSADQSFYWGDRTDIQPVEYLNKSYDSICITILATDSAKLFFSPLQMKNYTVNLFT